MDIDLDGAPPAVTSRNKIASLDDLVDEMMLSLPPSPDRETIEAWLRGGVRRIASSMEWGFRRAAERAFDQLRVLLDDPQHYALRKERRRRQREQWKQWEAESKARTAELEAAAERQRQKIRRDVAAGKLKAMPGLEFVAMRRKPRKPRTR